MNIWNIASAEAFSAACSIPLWCASRPTLTVSHSSLYFLPPNLRRLDFQWNDAADRLENAPNRRLFFPPLSLSVPFAHCRFLFFLFLLFLLPLLPLITLKAFGENYVVSSFFSFLYLLFFVVRSTPPPLLLVSYIYYSAVPVLFL